MVLDKKQHTSYASRQSAGQQQIRLEACTAGDIAIFVRVVAQAFGDPEPVLQERYMQELSQPNIRHYIAWLNEEPVGSVRLIGNAEEQYITALGVIPEYRGRGYGRQILDKAINLLLAMNCPHILIEVETENDTALSLYRTCGFITTRTFRYYTVQIASRTPAGVQE